MLRWWLPAEARWNPRPCVDELQVLIPPSARTRSDARTDPASGSSSCLSCSPGRSPRRCGEARSAGSWSAAGCPTRCSGRTARRSGCWAASAWPWRSCGRPRFIGILVPNLRSRGGLDVSDPQAPKGDRFASDLVSAMGTGRSSRWRSDPRQIPAEIEDVAHVGAAPVMGREPGHRRLPASALGPLVDGDRGQGVREDLGGAIEPGLEQPEQPRPGALRPELGRAAGQPSRGAPRSPRPAAAPGAPRRAFRSPAPGRLQVQPLEPEDRASARRRPSRSKAKKAASC